MSPRQHDNGSGQLCSSLGLSRLQDQPAFVALISFSMVALLFLVVQELLVEAHEKDGAESRPQACTLVHKIITSSFIVLEHYVQKVTITIAVSNLWPN